MKAYGVIWFTILLMFCLTMNFGFETKPYCLKEAKRSNKTASKQKTKSESVGTKTVASEKKSKTKKKKSKSHDAETRKLTKASWRVAKLPKKTEFDLNQPVHGIDED